MIQGMIELGDRAKDAITGVQGVVTGRIEYITGCRRFMLEYTGSDGQPKDAWFDEARLKLVECKVFVPLKAQSDSAFAPAGPMPAPTRPSIPSR
jgi:hypothetical protein